MGTSGEVAYRRLYVCVGLELLSTVAWEVLRLQTTTDELGEASTIASAHLDDLLF